MLRKLTAVASLVLIAALMVSGTVGAGEIFSLRTEQSKTFATDQPYTFRLRAYSSVIHYRDAAGIWQDLEREALGTTYQSSTSDGYIRTANCGTWAEARGATTGAAAVSDGSSGVMRGRYQEPLYDIRRAFFYFDTSAIPSTATIDSVDLKPYNGSGDYDTTCCAQKGTQGDPLTTADIDSFTGSEYGHPVSWVQGGWNTISFNATGKGDIEKDGITRICCREYTHDYLNSVPDTGNINGCEFAEAEGYEPYLEIEYSLGGSTPYIIIN